MLGDAPKSASRSPTFGSTRGRYDHRSAPVIASRANTRGGVERIHLRPAAEDDDPDAVDVVHGGARDDPAERALLAAGVDGHAPVLLARLGVDGVEVAGPVPDVDDAVHDRGRSRHR